MPSYDFTNIAGPSLFYSYKPVLYASHQIEVSGLLFLQCKGNGYF